MSQMKFYGFRSLTKNGPWVEPDGILLDSQEKFQEWVKESILDHYELRIVSEDKEDTNFQVIDKDLIFPRKEGYTDVPNIWDPIVGCFIPEGVERPETEGERFAKKHGLIH